MGGFVSIFGEGIDDGIVSVNSKTTTDSANFNFKNVIFPTDGVTLSFLDFFIEECGGKSLISDNSCDNHSKLHHKHLYDNNNYKL